MGTYIMKSSPDNDFYVEWSTVSDEWTFAGTRAEMLEYLHSANAREHPGFTSNSGNWPEDALRRCDESGTSYRFKLPGMSGPPGFWGDETIQIENTGTIPRDKLREYVEASHVGNQQAVDALITPFVWDD
jgi:hypothetical protein